MQTVDFFTPIVDDAYTFGQVAAANALSDVYAMGGRPITVMNLLGVPTDLVSPATIARILRGGAAKTKEVNCALVGGHTIRCPEPIYGLSVTGLVHPKKMLTNAAARIGDLLLLTKPLGTGIATTGIKKGFTSASLARNVVRSMRQINRAGADLAELRLVRCATDVTGFGLLGHLANICRASGVGAEVVASQVPSFGSEIFELIRRDCVPGGSCANLKSVEKIARWRSIPEPQRILLADAQTSGGLLLCVPPRRLDAVKMLLRKHRTLSAAVIGRITKSTRPQIVVH